MAVLVKSSDIFSDNAERIGLALKIPSFIIGVTLVSIGTSLPELISSIVAVLSGNSELVVANAVGSNITNIFLILGIAAIISKKLKVSFDLIHVDLPLIAGSAFLLAMMSLNQEITFFEGILLVFGAIIYLSYTISINKNVPKNIRQIREDSIIEKEIRKEHKIENGLKFNPLYALFIVISAFLIFFSATFTVNSIVNISEILNVGKDLVALTVVALGTSLPELIVTVTLARKGKSEMVLGNILGSNIFNIFGVVGIAALFGSLTISDSLLVFGIPMFIAAALLYFFTTQEKTLTKWEGGMLIIFYIFFIGQVLSLS
jgi:cation:H+ antiporter